MLTKQKLSYKALPLPDRHEMSDAEMREAARVFRDFMRMRHAVRDYSDRPVKRAVIEHCIAAAGTAPSGANHQTWHLSLFRIRRPSRRFERPRKSRNGVSTTAERVMNGCRLWSPSAPGAEKPHLGIAPWLIVVFAQRFGEFDDGTRYKNYYAPESIGIATGMLLAALHHAGLVTLTHTPNPMRFLNGLLDRPESEKPVMIIAVGHPSDDASAPAAAKIKKPLDEFLTVVKDEMSQRSENFTPRRWPSWRPFSSPSAERGPRGRRLCSSGCLSVQLYSAPHGLSER